MAGFPKAGDQYGRYRVVDEIGHGGMGVVYEAVDTVLNRAVALKIVLPSLADRGEYHQRFAQEAAALAKIHSRHIVGIYDYGEHEDTVFFATQYFPDGDLQSWLTKFGPLDRRAAIALVASVCEALADAHDAGIVHRDVKPGNVLLWSRPDGLIPYLADFGIAVEGAPEKRSGLTRTGTLIGSPAYMAPERHFGHPADERGDVYSAGCLLWSTLTGDAPYSGTDFQMMNSHINAPVVSLRTSDPVDLRIDAVLAGALEKDPDRRIQTPGELRARLTEIVRDIDTAGPPAPTRAPEPVQPRVTASETAARTAIRPTPAPEPAAGPPEPAQAAGRRRRRLAPVLLGAGLVLAVVAATTALVLARTDDDPVAQDPPAGSTSPAPTPPPAPAAPRIEPTPAYRAVAFAIDAAAGSSIEVNRGEGWEPAGRTVKVPTEEGGDQACLRARSVAEEGGLTSPSEATRVCGRAQPRTLALTRNRAAVCSYVDDQGNGFPCWWYSLSMSGFAAGSTQAVRMHAVGAPDNCPSESSCQQVEVDKSGRVDVPRFNRVVSDLGTWVVTVDGLTERVDLQGPYLD